MNENENLKQGQLMTINSQNTMVDLLQKYCEKGLNCLCLLKTTSKESLIQKLFLQQAGVNLNITLTMEDYKELVKAMHDICKWELYIDKFQTLAKTNNKIKKLKPDCVFIEVEENPIVNKHWQTMAEKRQVTVILVSYDNKTFNDDGKHTLNKASQKAEVKIIIDFIDRNLKIDIILPKNKTLKEDNNTEIHGIGKVKSYRILNKDFRITSILNLIIKKELEFKHNIFYYTDLCGMEIELFKEVLQKEYQVAYLTNFEIKLIEQILINANILKLKVFWHNLAYAVLFGGIFIVAIFAFIKHLFF